MTEQQERKAFDRRHGSDAVDLVVLTGERTGGAGKAGGKEALWTASADVLAYIDERGTAVIAGGRLSWLATDEQRGPWIHELKPLTQYAVRARRATPDPADYAKHGMPVPDLSHHFALDQVTERDVHVPALDDRLVRWLRPVSISTEAGDFELERSFGWFSGGIQWCGNEANVMLEVDEGSAEGAETCQGALARLAGYVAAMPGVDASWRTFAASKLTDLADDWRQDDEERRASEPITAEAFAQRIRLSELSIGADGATTPYYDDDELFWGHVILLDVEPDGTMTDAHIAG